jgi:hypothetical protein
MARGYWRVQRYQVFYGDSKSVYASTEKQAVKLARKYDGRAVECDGGRQVYPAAEQSVQPTLLESPRSEVVSCQCGLCKGIHTTLPQSG